MTKKTEISQAVALATNAVLSQAFAKAAQAQGKIGSTLLRDVTEFFATNPEDLIMAATDRKLVGIEAKTTEASQLSETRRLFRVYRDQPEAYREILDRGERGWRAIMADVAEVDNAYKAEKAEVRAIEKAKETAKTMAKGDPEEEKRLIDLFVEGREREKAEAEAKANREPTAREVAERVCAKWIKDRGADFAVEVIDLLPDVFDGVKAKIAKGEAVAA